MALPLTNLGIDVAILCIACAYLLGRRAFGHSASKLLSTENDLQKARQAEEHLQEEVKTLKTKLQQMLEDPVTHLSGMPVFKDRLTQHIQESRRYQLTLGVLYVDLDDFKVINNALGQKTGDILLREVAVRLQSCLRQVDSISRVEKDTFVILVTQLSKPETAAIVVQRILQSLKHAFYINEHELYVTASIGIAIYPNDAEDTISLLGKAEHALRLAKEKSKHGYQFYQEKMHMQSQRELALYTGLSREAIFKELRIYYQPIVNVQTEAIVCMDALLHWDSIDSGLISVDELATLMERQNKANLMTEWLLQTAGKQFLEWRSFGFGPEMLGIPISIKQLESSHFIYRISQLLQTMSFKPEWLLLEIKDSTGVWSFDVLEKSFNMLDYLGVKIAIDRFGADAFALLHLKHLLIHYFKLDKAFVADIEHNPQSLALVESMVFLAKSMSKQVIIQGVESAQQLAILKEIGCTLMQGDFLGAKLNETEVTAKMV